MYQIFFSPALTLPLWGKTLINQLFSTCVYTVADKLGAVAIGVKKLMPWFVKIEEGKVDKPTFDQYIPAHKAYIQELIAKGHKARTGYWAEARGGMLLFEAASKAEAEAIVASDPLVQHGCVNYQLYEWRIVME